MAQLALWTFDTLSGVGNGSFLPPTTESVRGTPTLQLRNQAIASAGAAGRVYTDSTGTMRAATSAAAWTDIKGDGDDAEFRVVLDTRGFTDLGVRFDINAASANDFDLQYSIDGGYTFAAIGNNISFQAGAYRSVTVDMSAVNAIENAPNVILRFFDFSHNGNNALAFDNLEITGTALVPAPNTPSIVFNDPQTTDFLGLNPSGRGWVNGSIGDATDPAKTQGIAFTVSNVLAGYTVTATSSNAAVVPSANVTISSPFANVFEATINPTGVGSTDITVTVTNPGGGQDSYVISYSASAAAADSAHTLYHVGSTDGSAAIALDDLYFLDANDENQTIGVYYRIHSGLPVKTFDFSAALGLTDQPKEVDIEDATRVGNRIYWMGSHSNNSSGEEAPNRDTVFSTNLSGTGSTASLTYQGKYTGLETDLKAWDAGNVHGLGANYFGFTAGAGPGGIPETPNGFNLEGLTMAPGSATTAYLSFRAPVKTVSGGAVDAVIVPVTNLTSIVDNSSAVGSAAFGAPILLDLGGRGIRSIEHNATGQYLILAGPSGSASGVAPANFALYTWDGDGAHRPVLHTANLNGDLATFGGSPEAIVAVPDNLTSASVIQILIDNGDTVFYGNGVSTKDQAQSTLQKFESVTVTLGGLAGATPHDLGGDGYSDLVYQQASSGQVLIAQLQGGHQPVPSAFADAQLGAGFAVVSTASDFNGDGKSDILWRDKASGATVLTFQDGSHQSQASGYTDVQLGLAWSVNAGDVDGDGKADLVYQNTTSGQTIVSLLNGTHQTVPSAFTDAQLGAGFAVAAVADFNGDGKADILYRDKASGATAITFQNGSHQAQASGYTDVQLGLDWTVQAADFTGDGKADLLYRNKASGATIVAVLDGTHQPVPSAYTDVQLGTQFEIAQLSDFNGDGRADILFRDASSGSTFIAFLNGAHQAAPSAYTDVQIDHSWLIV